MAKMFANIATSLNPGGRFLAITPFPALDLDHFAELHATPQARADMRKYGLSIDYLSTLGSGEGYNTRVTGHTSPVEVSFQNFHLRRECYEKAARNGGMEGKFNWKDVQLPDEEGSEWVGVEAGYWQGYGERPHFGILVVER